MKKSKVPHTDKPFHGYDEGQVYVITDEPRPDRYEGLDLAQRIDAVSRDFDAARGTDGFLDEVLISQGDEWQETPVEIAAYTGRSVSEVEQAICDLAAAAQLPADVAATVIKVFGAAQHVREVAQQIGLSERTVQAVIALNSDAATDERE